MKKILFSLAFVMLMISCKKEIPAPGTPDQTVPVAEETLPPDADGPTTRCFLYEANGSKIKLRLLYGDNDSLTTGELNYDLAEKDSNKGMFVGKFENNILIADYTFQSEGTESKRQVAFQLKDGKFIEGYGDMNEDGTRFKDETKIKFDSKMPLSEVECD
jgi:hypothetical protein